MTSPDKRPGAGVVGDGGGKPWRLYEVTVFWSDSVAYTETVSAPSASAARYQRFLSASDTRPDLTFRQFVGMSSVRTCLASPNADAYAGICRGYGLSVKHGDRVEIRDECASVNGRQGHVVHPNGHDHYVHVVLDGECHRGFYHPNSIKLLAPLDPTADTGGRGM